LAFENARLYATEHYIAETLQETLLTMPKKLPGVVFSHKYQSATEVAKVGGDFYDIFELEHQKVGIIIGDVSGKGVQASALTSVVKNTIKAHAYDTFGLAGVIGKTNEVLLKTAGPGLFVTVFFGVLDTKSGALKYCNAGHPQPIIRRKDGQAFFLPVSSPVTGVSDLFKFTEGKETLRQGDLLVAYTDGVIEARHDAGLFGEERLHDLIAGADVGATEITDAIFSEILKYAGGKLTDDVAILSLSLGHHQRKLKTRSAA
jgi:serine phosphatase RsbU (regulator of sigma subunit)